MRTCTWPGWAGRCRSPAATEECPAFGAPPGPVLIRSRPAWQRPDLARARGLLQELADLAPGLGTGGGVRRGYPAVLEILVSSGNGGAVRRRGAGRGPVRRSGDRVSRVLIHDVPGRVSQPGHRYLVVG